MKNKRTCNAVFFAFLVVFMVGCKKNFLDEKPSSKIVLPSTLGDITGLLDNPAFYSFSSPALAIISSDEFEYRDYNTWKSLPTVAERNTYIWASDLYEDLPNLDDWFTPYKCIFYANNAIAGLERIPLTRDNTEKHNYLKGWAHFNRAYFFYVLASNFCKSYDSQTAANDLGIPLKVSPAIDEIMQRSSLQETYEQIFRDLNVAKQMLEKQRIPSEQKNRPSLAAVYALEARIYLNMREYRKAEFASDNCLALYSKLIDYNSVKLPNTTPFSRTNVENIFVTCTTSTFLGMATGKNNGNIKIKESLLNLYDSEDLRAKIYFVVANGGGLVMNRGYFGAGSYPFTGLATDEIYLIKAECVARRGDFNGSMSVLNKLLINRFPTSKFIPKQVTSQQEAMEVLLTERRKELIWRGIRWEDLKRLNKEGANITLTRLLNGVTYSLLPNDPKYVFPIPSAEIAFSGITQNLR
ncbi:RagB/SusD family nutrient uptake outer membrane protein [Pedobacter sp. N36a]|uniref:RagB/SusD family nutrient uptake outer membrane protein n=1 Tax=Pedobacter sp. N36a TaxID=2767996 RepID=UPI001656DBBA|nr:RagB/SusD family nutrient uptake outer membrane protein [Pedobacter sp. N36a]MBC8986512.1 RagB/SusD family nutrient uptake outer membrane protein [Pedobacter sp. N36a]